MSKPLNLGTYKDFYSEGAMKEAHAQFIREQSPRISEMEIINRITGVVRAAVRRINAKLTAGGEHDVDQINEPITDDTIITREVLSQIHWELRMVTYDFQDERYMWTNQELKRIESICMK